MPRGRPSIFSDSLADEILELVAQGNSLVSICADDAMPGYTTVRRWLAANESFRLNYARAREAQAEWYADRIADAASQAPALIEGRVDPGEVQHRRLEIDSLKWIASKLLPKKYGDAVAVTHAGSVDSRVTITEDRLKELREKKQRAIETRLNQRN